MMQTGHYYTISHLVLITGLTGRTIRNYIASGILEGEKINGLWHFTPEQADAFLRHPTVRPSILAKNNAIVYDFLLHSRKQSSEICMVLDLPEADAKQTAEFFCYAINNGDFHNVHFAFDSISGTPRVILKGPDRQVLDLVNRFYEENL